MGNKISARTVADILNRIMNDDEDGIKISIQGLVLASGEKWEIRDSAGFLVYSVDEFGNIKHLGDISKL